MQSRQKISSYQFSLFTVMIVMAPLIRILSTIVADKAEQASWIVPVISFPVMIIIALSMVRLIKNRQETGLIRLCQDILTKPVGTALLVLIAGWTTVLTALYLRYFAERIVATLLPDASISFFSVILMAVVGLIAGGNLAAFARLNEILFYGFISAFFIMTALSITENFNLDNLLPVSGLDVMPVISGVPSVIAIWGYYVLVFFISDKVNLSDRFKRQSVLTCAALLCLSLFIFVATVGGLGHAATSKLNYAYFEIVKTLSLIKPLEHVQGILLSMWVVTDYTIICLFSYIVSHIGATLLQLSDRRYILYPLVILIFFLSGWLWPTHFDLQEFSVDVAVPINFVLFTALPLLLLIVGKIRKKI